MLHFHGNFSVSQEDTLANYLMRLQRNQGIHNLMITFISRKYPFSGVSLNGTQIPKLQLTFLRDPTPAVSLLLCDESLKQDDNVY